MSRNERSSTPTTPTTPTSPKIPTTPTTASRVNTKLCHIIKRPDFDGYGFNLHSEKIKPGQYIGKVDANSPAEAAGLKEGDRIIEVNGAPIGNETHKQVVQRIKALACEVRLLLVDVHGESQEVSNDIKTSTTSKTASANGNNSTNNNNNNGYPEYKGTIQEMPGASANISSISMVSTKRMSSSSNESSSHQFQQDIIDMDVTDKSVTTVTSHEGVTAINASVPASSSSSPASISVINQQAINKNTNNNYNNNKASITSTSPDISAEITTVPNTTSNKDINAIKAGSLQLPMTAAEMRAKLMSKKKYDPKNESVDLKKKFEIIQKL